MRRKFLNNLPYRWAPVNDKERPVKAVHKKKQSEMICPVCDGAGMVIDRKTSKYRQCVACQGVGRVKV
jgi:DnaJ-class molecular chaperone